MKTAKSLAVLQGGIRIGSASLADFTENEKGIKIKTHDGDTVNVRLADRFGLRFLGIDTPEVSMMLPGETRFKSLSNVGWDTLFTSGNWKKGMNLSSALLADLEKRAGDGTGVAANHARYARKAKISLEEIISEDIRASGVSAEKFGLFMSFVSRRVRPPFVLPEQCPRKFFRSRHSPRRNPLELQRTPVARRMGTPLFYMAQCAALSQ